MALAVAYSMTRSAKRCRARSRALTLHARAQFGAQRGQVVVGAHERGEVVVRVRQAALAQLAELRRELDLLAGQLGLAVVLGEGHREGALLVLAHADEVGLEARHHALLADDEREALSLGAIDRLAVAAALEADDREVVGLGGAVLDRHQRGLLVAQLLDDGLDLVVGDLVDLRREGEAGVVAELDLRADRQRDPVRRALALREARPLRLAGQLQDVPVGFLEGLQDGALVEVLAGLVVDGVGRVGVGAVDAQGSLQDLARRLAGPEAGHAGAAGKMPDALVDGLLELLGGDLDLQHDGAAVAFADVGLHGVLVHRMGGSATRV